MNSRPLPFKAWPEALADARHILEIHPRYLGYAVRTDAYRCRNRVNDWHMIYLIHEGEIHGRVNGKAYQLTPGTVFWLSPGASLDMIWPATLVFSEVWFRVAGVKGPLRLDRAFRTFPNGWDVGPFIDRVAEEVSFARPFTEVKRRLLLSSIAIECARIRSSSGAAFRQLNAAQRTRLVRFVRENLHRRPSLEELAALVDLSPDYFSRLFRQTFGAAPRTWVARERIRSACRMLKETNLAAYRIADRLGYANVSQFSRQFKKEMGKGPRLFRRSV